MNSVETTRKTASEQPAEGTRRPRRRIAKQILERGRRLRSRVGVFIGVSMGLVAVLTVMD